MGAKYMRVDDANDLALRRSQRFNSRVGPSSLSKKYLYKKPALGICSRLYSRTRTSVDNETNTSDNSCMRYQIFGRKLYYCGLIMFEKQYLRRQFHIFGYIYMENIISIQLMVLKGYVNADYADVYVFLVHKATC